MSRLLGVALMVSLAAPQGAQAQTEAAEFSVKANRACADQLFSRPEGVMKDAREAEATALSLRFGRKPPDAATVESAARAIGPAMAEMQRLRAGLTRLEAPGNMAQDWDALLGVVDFNIRRAESREAFLLGKTDDILLAHESPVPKAALDSLAERLSSDWPDCEMALHAEGPPEVLRPLYHRTNELCAAIFTGREGPEGRAASDTVLDAFIAAREGRLTLPDAELEAALRYEEQRARTAASGFATLAAEAPAGVDTWAWLQDRQRQYADFHAARLRVVTSDSADPSADFLAVQRPPLPERSIDDLGLRITQCRKIAL